MVEWMRVKDFQPHGDFLLELSRGVTCIRGPSDAGKTALLRALRWACCNEPRGDAFVRHGQDPCAVTVGVDGREVVRSRGKGDNSYSLDGQDYKAFGNGVPDPVADMLNVDPSLNFQAQLEPLFWLSKSPGEVARELNRVVNLERIDAVLSRANSEVKRVQDELESLQDERKRLQETVGGLEWAEGAEGRLTLLERRLEDCERDSQLLDRLREAQEESGKVRGRLLLVQEALEPLQSLAASMESHTTKSEELSRAFKARDDRDRLRAECDTLNRELDREEERLLEMARSGCPACGRPL